MLQLSGKTQQTVAISALSGRDARVHLGNQDAHEVEVAVLESSVEIKEFELRAAWRERSNNGDRKVLVMVDHGDRVTLFGPALDRQPATVKIGIAQRLAQNFLDAPDLLSAVREVVGFFDAHSTSDLGGIKNKGLFASHHLRENLPKRRDWQELQAKGFALAEKRHRGLIEALGFEIAKEERNAMVLRTDSPESRVIALVLEDNESFDSPSNRFPSSPVSLGLSMAAEYNVPWLILVRKDHIRLHPCKDGVGVGQKGQAETYLELNLTLLDDDNIGLLPLVFSASSLSQGGEVDQLLADSSKFATSLGNRLRERVYEQVVPPISIAVAKKLQAQGKQLDSTNLQAAYSMTLKILFRLLFQAYAEDRGLLPAGRNPGFDANSLKELGKRHMETPVEAFGESSTIWYDLVQVWDAIDVGNDVWQIPAYNGGLFGSDPQLHPEGAAVNQLQLPDSVLGPALQGLLIDATEDGVHGPVDFRALSVREFGTIYEGLLESSLSLAEQDLTVDASNAWVPAKDGDLVFAKAGAPYFHSASGERKATGSYFTPKFVVDHLVQKAIDPTIDAHLEKIANYLRAGDTATAGREFFDFRVADLAMGSAHFLVAAVDRIEAKMRAFLAQPENDVPAVREELGRLRKAAVEALKGDDIVISEIEDFSLLRRQIARRCIYGIDINYMAVELARLAIWIHTFVPGLPMSTLDHNLVHGNSLTGIGSIDEALDALVPGRNNQPTLFDGQIIAALQSAKELLIDAAEIGEADKREISSARKLAAEAALATRDIALVFDAAVAARVGTIDARHYFDFNSYVEAGKQPEVRELVESLRPAHLPHRFPEVFLRENGGFDVLVGNPPWEKVKPESQRWWGMHLPGIRALPKHKKDAAVDNYQKMNPALAKLWEAELHSAEALRKAVYSGNYPGLGAGGDLDLANAFAWANYNLCRRDGSIALVLPRSAFSAASLKVWREKVLEEASFVQLTFAANKGEWLFQNVDTRQSVAFCVLAKEQSAVLRVAGPVHSIEELHLAERKAVEITVDEFKSWSDTLTFPVMDDVETLEIFRQMQLAPKLAGTTPRCVIRPYAELHSKNDSHLFSTDVEAHSGNRNVWGGASFQLWNPDFAPIWAKALSANFESQMRAKFDASFGRKVSPYFGWHPGCTLPMNRPRIAIRKITNRTNVRTVIACLLPEGAAVDSAPVLVVPEGNEYSEAFVLGVLCSMPFDWQARRIVEGNVVHEILYRLTVPWQQLDTQLGHRLVELAGRLAAVDERYDDWSAALGLPVGSVKTDEQKHDFVCEIDALVSLMYGLSEEQVAHIYKTFHRWPDHAARLDRVMDFYRQWKDQADA